MNSGTNGEFASGALELIEQLKSKVKNEELNRNSKENRNMLLIGVVMISAVGGAGFVKDFKIAVALVVAGLVALLLFFTSTARSNSHHSRENNRFLSDEELAIIATLPAEMLEPMKVYLEANGCITVSEVLSAVEAYPQHVADRDRRSLPGFQQIIAKSSAPE